MCFLNEFQSDHSPNFGAVGVKNPPSPSNSQDSSLTQHLVTTTRDMTPYLFLGGVWICPSLFEYSILKVLHFASATLLNYRKQQ